MKTRNLVVMGLVGAMAMAMGANAMAADVEINVGF